jgi:hypothetical protein
MQIHRGHQEKTLDSRSQEDIPRGRVWTLRTLQGPFCFNPSHKEIEMKVLSGAEGLHLGIQNC